MNKEINFFRTKELAKRINEFKNLIFMEVDDS